MKEYRFRTDVERAMVEGFALPLGFEPGNIAHAPRQGYTIAYNAGEGDDPDTYTFQITVSHERLAPLCHRCFALLPEEEVYAIVEIGSRDAYRSVDVYLSAEPTDRRTFLEVWNHFEPFLLEDGSIGVGANSDSPFVEIFIDQRKTLILHVPLDMEEEVEAMLQALDLEQVPETWPKIEDGEETDGPRLRSVLDLSDAYCPDVDELLLQLRQSWNLQLNVDPEENLDEAGRELGMTLWQAVLIVNRLDDPEAGAYLSMWLTANSLSQAEQLIHEELEARAEWSYLETYTLDRIAFDERPDELADLAPRRTEAGVHLVSVDPWTDDGKTPADG